MYSELEIAEFNKWLEANVPFSERLEETDRNELIKLYFDLKKAKKISKNTWDAAYRSRSGVDFSTDIRKATEREVELEKSLREYISDIEEYYKSQGL